MDWTWLDCIHISFTYIIYHHTRFSSICWILEDSATWKTHSGGDAKPWIFSVLCFWWLKRTALDWNMPGWENRYYMYVRICIYIYMKLYLRVYMYILQNILNIHDIHCIAFTLIESEAENWRPQTEPDEALKFKRKSLGIKVQPLGKLPGNYDFMFVVFVWFWGEKSQGWSIFAPIGCPCFSFVFVFFVLQ